jgi:hypothetical protein
VLPSNILQKIALKGSDKEQIAAEVAREPGGHVAALLEGLSAERPEVRFGCSKVLGLISSKNPALLYRHMDFFIAMLDHKNTFLRLDAARIVANLAAIDTEGKFEGIFDRFFAPIPGPALISAATVIGAGAGLAKARPELAGRISAEILKVAGARYATMECRNVALGHAIKSFDVLYDLTDDKASIARLVRKQLKNRRAATRKKAERFVRRHGL